MSAKATFKYYCTTVKSVVPVKACAGTVKYRVKLPNSETYSKPVLMGEAVNAAEPFKPKAEVGYYASYQPQWEVGFATDEKWAEWEASNNNNLIAWQTADTSQHELHLTWKTYSPAYETVFYISCNSAQGQKKANDIVGRIWDVFSGTCVKRKDGVDLTYYASFKTRNLSPNSLLIHTDGQCNAWATFFREALDIHGIENNIICFCPANGYGDMFLVNTWSFSDPGSSSDHRFPYRNELPVALSFESCIDDKQYIWAGNPDVEYTAGMRGQNNDMPAALFTRHFIVEYNGIYFDPSYGLKHLSKTDVEKTLSGFAKKSPNGEALFIRKSRLRFFGRQIEF